MQSRRDVFWFAVVSLVALVVAAHWPGLNGAFVFDDLPEIVDNPRLSAWPVWRDFVHPRAIPYLTLRLNYWIGGVYPLGYHVANLTIHVLAAFSCWGVLREIFVMRAPSWPSAVQARAEPIAFVSALAWAVHPITTQSVAYVIQRAESLWSLFFLIGFGLYLVAVRQPNELQEGLINRRRVLLACSIGMFWLSMGSKEPSLLSLLAIPLTDRLFSPQPLGKWGRSRAVYFAVLLFPIAVAVPLTVLPTLFLSDRTATGGFFIHNLTPWQYWCSQPQAILHYLRLIVMPIGQNLDYLWPPQTNPLIILATSLVLLSMILVSLWGWLRNAPWSLFPLLFVANISTTSLIPLSDIVVEHRVYLASAWVICGLAVGAVVVFEAVVHRNTDSVVSPRHLDRVLFATTVVVVGIFSTLTYRRSMIYESALRVWQDVAEKAPWNFRAHHNVGSEWMKLGKPEQAVEAHLRAINAESLQTQIDSQQAKAFDGLADALSATGDLAGAVKAAKVAIDLTPGGSDHLLRLADIYAEHRQWSNAEASLRQAIANRPSRVELYEHLTTILIQQRRWADAHESWSAATKQSKVIDDASRLRSVQLDWMLGNFERAQVTLQGVVDRQRKADSLIELSGWLLEEGRSDESEALLATNGIASGDHPQLRLQRYRNAVDEGNLNEADRLIRDGLSRSTTAEDRLIWQVESALQTARRGDLETAMTQISQLQRSNPNKQLVLTAIGDIFRWNGKSEQAIAAYQEAMKAGSPTSALLNNLGALLSANDPVSAERYLRQAIELDPRNYQAWHSLGNTLVRQQRISEAKVCYENALKIQPTFTPARQTLSRIVKAIENQKDQ
ncbi:tetratricopeptide repeat protein [Neorhodopirellula pilleata]|uniref:Tetratricopeptide repeat protein n=1 Tax=Neorhodopirellula pilleata TaxID=2714738 RepID=A0A5C5ZFV7_9BACT|nr:tetratricopeptide repeat protein [Neorhodopirellula pilleata]TWT86078.1 tetratricopeptide repeat protein [Neorhodopirellula pilleata]